MLWQINYDCTDSIFVDGTSNKLCNVFYKISKSYFPIIWMFCSRTSRNKLNDIHENCLCLVKKWLWIKVLGTTKIISWNLNPENLHQLPHDSSVQVFTWAISWINDWHFYSPGKSLQHSQYSFTIFLQIYL